MCKRLIISLLVSFTMLNLQAQQEVINRLVGNLNEVTLHQKVEREDLVKEFMDISEKGRFGGADDLKLYLEVNSSDSEIKEFMDTQKADGSWPDIDYKDRNNSSWAPKLHAIRFQTMAKSYKTPGSKYFNSKELSLALHKAMSFWFEKKLVCPNWWYNDIGIPLWMGPGFLLIKDELTPYEKGQAQEIMKKKVYWATGQNKVWIAGNMVICALLSDNLPLAVSSRDSIASEIYVTTKEGLQPDYSFHQHGAQMQFGNYGLAYISSMAYWARVFEGTPLAFDSRKMKYLRNYILEGIQWTIWKGKMDPGACARQVFNNSQKAKSFSLSVSILNMMKADVSSAGQFGNFINENLLKNTTENNLLGHKYFWRSEYAIHRTPTWFASLRMNSSRTKGIEMTNGENLQGFYAADGVMSIMNEGNEYENIFPIWNWRRLPGLTVQDGNKPTVDYSLKRSDFVGGVSDGEKGASAMILKHDGLTAYKSYFFIHDVIICLGAGISTINNLPVFTSLDQPYLKGDVTYYNESANREAVLADNTEITRNDIKGVYHNKIGYYLIKAEKLHISNKLQKGNWGLIADFYKNIPDSGKVFNLFIEHGVMPQNTTYEYCILPNTTKVKLLAFMSKPTVKVLKNSTECQSVTDKEQSICQTVFYKAGTVNLGKLKVHSENAGIVMLEKQRNGRIKITVEDPTQKLIDFVLVVSGKFSGKNVTYNPESRQTRIKIPLPQTAGYRGSSVSIVL